MAIRLKDKLKLGDGLNTTGSVDTGDIDINGTADISGILTLSKSTGTLITSAAATDAFGYNATAGLGHYIRGTASTYIYGGGKFHDGTATHTLLHDGSTISTDQISNLSGSNTGDQTLPTDFVSAANGGIFSGNVQFTDPTTAGTSAKVQFGTNTGWNNNIGIEAYWMVLGCNQNEGFKFEDSTGNMLLKINGANSSGGNGILSATFKGNLSTDANLDTSGTLTWAKNQADSYTYSAADSTGMYIERVSTAGAGSTKADIRLQARNNNSGTYSVLRVKGSDNTIHLTAADTLMSGNLAVEGNNLFLGKDGADPRIDMMFTDHASGAAWDTRIFIGKSDNLAGGTGTFPTYTPAGAYGIQFQANSDGVFFGMEEYSTGNYRPIIQWGDDDTDTPFRIKHENGSELEVSRDGQVTATSKFIAPTLTSTVATGTAPLTVTSTTKVTNLNAHYFDGASTSYFLNTSSTSQTKTGALDVGALKVDGKKVLDLPSNAGSERGPWNPIVTSIRGSGKMLHTDEEFAIGSNGIGVYNNSGGTGVVITRETDGTTLGATAPNNSGYVLKIVHNGNTTSPGHGGFISTIPSEDNHTFVQIFQAKLDTGRSLVIAENAQGSNNSSYWLTETAGTGKWEWYARVSHCGDSGTFSGGGHVYVSGGTSTFTWYLASCTVIDVNDASELGPYLLDYNNFTNTPSIPVSGTDFVSKGSGGAFGGNIQVNAAAGYPLQTSSTQRYNIQIRNTNNSVNSGYGWWLATDPNFNFALHADGAADKFTLTRSGNATFAGTVGGTNLSGTNTGDQTLPTTLPATTSDTLDFFQDSSGVSLHQFNNSLNDVGGNYNATSIGASYGTGLDTKFGSHGLNTQGDGVYVDIAGLPTIQAVSIWYKAIGNDNGYIVDFRHDTPGINRSYLYTLAGSDQYISWSNDTTRTGNTGDIWINGVSFPSGNYNFTSGNWYHIVLSTNTVSTTQTWDQGIRIGNRSDGTSNGNAGYFDQVRTFNRRLTSSDVALLYAEVETGATADQTAGEILSLIKTVDGASSGLDADLLDGNNASAFALSSIVNQTDFVSAANGGTFGGTVKLNSELQFLRGSTDYSNYIRASAYPSEGYSGTSKYWLEYGAKGGHHFVLNTDGGSGSVENAFDDFTIWNGAVDGDRLLEVTNAGNATFAGKVQGVNFSSTINTTQGGFESSRDYLIAGTGDRGGGLIISDISGARNAIYAGGYDLTFAKETDDGAGTLSHDVWMRANAANSAGNITTVNIFKNTNITGNLITEGNVAIQKNTPLLDLGTSNSSTGNARINFYSKNNDTANGYSLQFNKDTGIDRLEFIDGSGNANIKFNNGGSATFAGAGTFGGNLTTTGNLFLGSTGTENFIAFKGTTGDSTGYSTTFIGEYLYGGTEQSELILYKGNDGHASSASPDRIRLIGANLCFDVYDVAQSYPTTMAGVAALSTTRAMTILTNGKVGIGVTVPKAMLHIGPITGGVNGVAQERLRITGDYAGTGTGALIRFTNQHDTGTNPNAGEYNLAGIKAYDYRSDWGGALALQTAPNTNTGGTLTDRLTILPEGLIGIGTNAPATKLDVRITTSNRTTLEPVLTVSAQGNGPYSGFGPKVSFNSNIYYSSTTAGNIETAYIGAVMGTTYEDDSDLVFGTRKDKTTVNEKMRISGRGEVLIGTTTKVADVKLRIVQAENQWPMQIVNTGGAYGLSIDTSASTHAAAGSFQIYPNAGAFKVQNDGKVGIGTTAPGAALHVQRTSFPQVRINDETGAGEAGIRMRSYNGSTNDLHGDIFVDASAGIEVGRMGFRVPWNGGEKMTILSGGNVGIGTTNPTRKLNVLSGTGAGGADGTAAIKVGGTSNYDSLEFGIVNNYDGMIRTYGNDLAIYAGHWRTIGNVSTEDHQIKWHTSKSGSSNWSTPKMYLDHNGYLGIGTTSPSKKLHVAGTAQIDGVLVLKGQQSNYDGSTGRTSYWNYDANVALALEPAADDGAVAIFFKSIGNAPSDFGYIAFDEDYGEAGVTAGENSALVIGCENDGLNSSDHVRVKSRLVVEADLSSSDSIKAFQVKASNVTADLFHVNRAGGGYLSGTFNATGDIVAYYSDMRLKTKLGDIDNAISKIQFLNGFYYEPNEKAIELGYEKERRIGLSAQEVQAVVPEAVSKAAISHDPNVDIDYLSVDYAKLVPLLVEGIKELKAEIEELKKQIK